MSNKWVSFFAFSLLPKTVRSLISLLPLILLFTSVVTPAQADNGTPPEPLRGTYADFYVSWNDGDNANPGTIDQPFKTPDRAISLLKSMSDPSGKIVLIRGGNYRLRDSNENRLNLKHLYGKPGAPIQIRGYPGEEVMLDAFLDDFDPMNPSYMPCGWGGISINESDYLWVENFKVQGRCQSNVELLNSNHIMIRYIEAFRSDKHGLFTGGSFCDLTIECCKFYEQIYGSSASHGIYISGGHWNPELPPVRNVKIRYVESYYNGRHGIQFNGRMENVVIEHCDLHHNILGGISLIGVRNVLVENNRIYKNNKQGVILYTYIDTAYWDPEDPASMEHWLKTHWTIENVMIRNNTIFMDDIPWYVDEWVYYKPTYHAAIYLVDTSGMLPPFKNIWIMNNILYSHSDMMVNIANPEFQGSVRGISNVFYSEPYAECVACAGLFTIAQMEASHPELWNSNLAGLDPMFMKLTPTEMIDRTYEEIDFSAPAYTDFPDDFHLQQASPAWTYNAGAFTHKYDTADTVIDTSKPNNGVLPPSYGAKIVKMLFKDGVSPEIQQWFLDHFNLDLECLSLRKSHDHHDRICFRDEDRKLVSFAFLNTAEEPVDVRTCLTSDSGDTKYTDLFGVTFDAHHEIKVLNNLSIENNEIRQTVGENTLVVLLVKYSE